MPPHIYKLKSGERVPSVTTVIKNLGGNVDGLVHWAYKLGVEGKDLHEARQTAMNIGTITHARIEALIKGETIKLEELPPELVKASSVALEAWQSWSAMFRFEPIASETPLVSEVHRFGGTLDCAAVAGKRTIFDWKVTTAIYPEHLIQVAAYAKLWEENNPEQPIEQLCIVRLGKEEPLCDCILRPPTLIADAWDVFLDLRRIHDRMPRLKKAA